MTTAAAIKNIEDINMKARKQGCIKVETLVYLHNNQMGLLVSRFAPGIVGGGFDSYPSYVLGSMPRSREQVFLRLGGMYLMIGATLKSAKGQVVVTTQANN